ncbi:MAG: multi-sensor signal transduction multi-kinase, partial [Proteobacteria bacterium]|nr:multi-sensor signal transduction multi-kinase [Pseudomonadota bacterium]
PTAEIYIREARRLYRACHATAMEARLQIDYKGLLEPDDEGEYMPLPPAATADVPRTLPNLDVDYLLKSSLAIVAETDRQSLWHRIMNVVIECSGAQRGYFIIREGDELAIRAESDIAEKARVRTDLRKLSETENICKAIVRYVFHTRERVLLADACHSGDFCLLPEVQALQLRSVLCLPVIKQNDLVGVLFLENRLAEGVFTPEKVEMTELLTSHIAISVQNARLLAETREHQAKIQRLNAELERRVLERTAQLAAANKELESFSYSVSHDLRAPLRSVTGFSRLLLTRHSAQLDREGLDYLERVCRASERMDLLIDDLLKLSRITQAGIKRTAVDVSALAAEIVLELKAATPDREVEVDIDPGIELQADPGLLQIALQNLLANAFKFTRLTTPARIRLEALDTAIGKGFIVRDNGVGFDPTLAPQLFAPFQRLHTSGQFEGMGIGLAIVQRIINRHGGHIRAESSPGNGAAFFVELP